MELAAYRSEQVWDIDILAYWNQSSHSILKQVARQILCIPASSAGSERKFSIAGKTQTVSRAKLSPEKLCAQVIVANYLRANR